MGYSLPEADYLARKQMMNAFQNNMHCKWLLVDPSKEIVYRYRRLFGGDRFTVANTTLAEFTSNIQTSLEQAFPSLLGIRPPTV